MFALLGMLKDPMAIIKGVLLAGLLACVGYVIYDYFDTKKELGLANTAIAVVTAERDTTARMLEDERKEIKRVNALLVDAKSQRVEAQVIYVDRQVKVVEYKNDPNVQHCDLDAKWMLLANEAAVSPYTNPKDASPR